MRHIWIAFALAFAVMAWGFLPSTIAADSPPDPLRIVHGLLAAGWMLLLIIQSWLGGRWRMAWHRRFGWASVAIVPALLLSSLLVVHDELQHSTYFSRDLRLTLTWLDLISLIAFTGLWGTAIATRRNWRRHARWVGCTLFPIFPPAIGRILPGVLPIHGLSEALRPAYAICLAILAGLIARDVAKRGHPLPYIVTFAIMAFAQAFMFMAPGWGWFARIVEALGPIG